MAHFYHAENGKVHARHFVPMATRPGELRPTRITDARKAWQRGEMWVPSVTTVLGTLDKGGLTRWLIDQHLQVAHAMAAADIVRLSDEGGNINLHTDDYEWFISECKRLTELEMDKAPQAGTDVHKWLERWMTGEGMKEAPANIIDICGDVDALLHNKCGDNLTWEPEVRFTDDRGFGGCADLVDCASIERVYDSGGWVIDYKTKQTADKFKPGKMAYPDHSRQLAAYREGLGIPNARCANVFICIETGEVDFHEHTEEQLRNGWEVFQHALAIWQLTNDYPKNEEQAA